MEKKRNKKVEERTRKTGIDVIGNAPWGTHLCQFYQNKKDLIDILVPYFKAGLENNEFCMWVCWDPLQAEEARTALSKTLGNLDNYIKKDQIEIVDYSKRYKVKGDSGFSNMKQFWIEKEKLAFERGFDGLRLAGNTYWLERNEWKDFVKYEEEVDSIIKGHKMLAICPYSLDKCGASEVIDVVKNHQFALIKKEGKWEMIESSERKKAEEEASYEQALMQTLLNNIPDYIYFKDKNRRFVRASKYFCDLFHLKLEDIIGKRDEELFPKEIAEETSKEDQHIIETGKPLINKIEGGEIGGEEHWVLTTKLPWYDKEGNVIGLFGFSKDVTKLKKAEEAVKESEEKFRQFFENAPEYCYMISSDGKILDINNSALTALGYKKEEAVGKPLLTTIYAPSSQEKAKNLLMKWKKTGKLRNEELNIITKTGEEKTVLLSADAIRDTKGKLIHSISIQRDITEMKKLEKDKKILSEKVTKLTKKIPLTQNEKLVFYGLVKYPLLNDQQLSDKLKIKRSTITAIKNKLLRRGFYSTYIIPNFELIGCELMCIVNGKIPVEELKERKKRDIIKKLTSSPEVVFDIGTDKDFLGIIISKNFVETKRIIDYVSTMHEESDIELPNIIYFPFEMSRIINLFDYSNLLKSLFNLKIKEDIITPIKSTKKELTNNEKTILYALTKYPDLADTEISAKTRISRPTVSQIKKNLLKEDFLKIVNIPDARKLDCELLVYSHTKIVGHKRNKLTLEIPSCLFTMMGEREMSCISIFENYTKYKIECDKLTNLLKKKQLITNEPIRYLFPIQQIKFQKIEFAPLVKKIFELKVDF